MSEPTLSDLYSAYVELHIEPHCKGKKDIEGRYERYLKRWADRPASGITRLEVIRLHAELGKTVGKTSANNAIQLLRPIYNKAIEWGLVSGPNPAKNVRMFHLQPRERFFEKDELKRFFAATATLRYSVTRDFLHMCLYTAVRRTAVASMRWEDISLDRCEWYLSDSKNGTSQRIPLLPQALAILARRLRDRRNSSPWVFPSERSDSGHLTKPDKAWKVTLERARLTDARIHDLRRTLASWQALTGSNISVIAATLNHKDLKSTSVYAKLNTAAIRQSMERATTEWL